jgi:hypothetical protein
MPQRNVGGNTVITVIRLGGRTASLAPFDAYAPRLQARAARRVEGAVDVRRGPMISLPPKQLQTRQALAQEARCGALLSGMRADETQPQERK